VCSPPRSSRSDSYSSESKYQKIRTSKLARIFFDWRCPVALRQAQGPPGMTERLAAAGKEGGEDQKEEEEDGYTAGDVAVADEEGLTVK